MSEPSRVERVDTGDGKMDLSVWLPPAGRGPGLLLPPEVFGVGAYIKAVAERLTGLGYVVGAPDLFWRTHPGWAAEHDAAGLKASLKVVADFDQPKGASDSVLALHHLEELREVDRVGVIGFCLGGTMAWLAAAIDGPATAVCYYGSGIPDTLAQLTSITCPVLLQFGDADEYIAPEKVVAVSEAVAAWSDVELHVHHAGHAFDNHESERFFNREAAATAWEQTVAFLARTLPTR